VILSDCVEAVRQSKWAPSTRWSVSCLFDRNLPPPRRRVVDTFAVRRRFVRFMVVRWIFEFGLVFSTRANVKGYTLDRFSSASRTIREPQATLASGQAAE